MIGKEFTPKDFSNTWCDSFSQRGLAFDPYIQWFWPQAPDWPGEWVTRIEDLYGVMFRSLTEVKE